MSTPRRKHNGYFMHSRAQIGLVPESVQFPSVGPYDILGSLSSTITYMADMRGND